MKYNLFVLILSVALFAVNCSQPEQNAGELVADASVDLKVEGMVCAVGCAKYIEKEIAKMDGVADCKVNFEEGTAEVKYSKGVTNGDEILESIAGLNDGQYQASIVETHKIQKSSSGPKNEQSGSMDEPEVSFHFPELVTYLLTRLVR